jgi:hypothetical protein
MHVDAHGLRLAASSRRDGAGRPGGTIHQRAGVWTTIYQLSQRELLTASATLRPLNLRHVRYVHRGELRMELAHGLRRPVGRALPFQPQEQMTSHEGLGGALMRACLLRPIALARRCGGSRAGHGGPGPRAASPSRFTR